MTVTPPAAFDTPAWVRHAVFYQIFPERFANGDPSNDPENVQPWGTPPTLHNFMGGDLQGIVDHLDYLVDLGVNALYLTPIFHSPSNHKYNTYDYTRIDPHFGDMAAFRRLIDGAHERGMRIVLDGVFNHCGRGFFAFNDILENEAHSPYLRWFHVDRLPLHPYDPDRPAGYRTWWDFRSLPKFNTDHPPVRRYLLGVARYWIEQGADGWRLDVPNEIADHSFWREFRTVVKSVNPEAYIVGEIWQDGTPWLDGTQFDAVMNYLFRDLCRDFFARDTLRADSFAAGIDRLLAMYPRPATEVQLNLLGSHDTARFRTEAGGSAQQQRLATLFQMVYPGAPCIYYGDEVGMLGGPDPLCRGCFPWDEARWDHEMLAWTRRCVALRRAHPALRTGAYRSLLADGRMNIYAFARWDEREQLVVALNNSATTRTLDLPLRGVPLPPGVELRDLLSGEGFPTAAGRVEGVRVPARGAVVLQWDC
ncbi:MAG TPA: glycoside hydrolase family 13 protein [Roseiflexaceae bacterium]|nr:glycoside hydrolase family 13 protein [Roseiflexaceae bacterium]